MHDTIRGVGFRGNIQPAAFPPALDRRPLVKMILVSTGFPGGDCEQAGVGQRIGVPQVFQEPRGIFARSCLAT